MMISRSSSAAVRDNFRMPKSSMIGEFLEQGMGLAVDRCRTLHTNPTGTCRISSFLPPHKLKSMYFGVGACGPRNARNQRGLPFADESYAPQAERARNVVV